jgi:hypothetical protein
VPRRHFVRSGSGGHTRVSSWQRPFRTNARQEEGRQFDDHSRNLIDRDATRQRSLCTGRVVLDASEKEQTAGGGIHNRIQRADHRKMFLNACIMASITALPARAWFE